jgi:hypothetical protein
LHPRLLSLASSEDSLKDLAVLGSARVTVVNPPPGGGESNPLTFTILPDAQTQAIPVLSREFLLLFGLILAIAGILLTAPPVRLKLSKALLRLKPRCEPRRRARLPEEA